MDWFDINFQISLFLYEKRKFLPTKICSWSLVKSKSFKNLEKYSFGKFIDQFEILKSKMGQVLKINKVQKIKVF